MDVTKTVYTWSRDEVSSCIVRRSLIDMYAADACVVKEKQLQERRNCGTGQRLDCVNVLQILTFVLN